MPVEVPESHRDLLEQQVAALTTIGNDGFPQTTAVWFVHEDGELTMSVNETRQKLKNMLRRPDCNLFILDPANPLRYLEIRARAELAIDDDRSAIEATRRKYDADVSSFDPPGQRRYAVKFHPVRVRAVDISQRG